MREGKRAAATVPGLYARPLPKNQITYQSLTEMVSIRQDRKASAIKIEPSVHIDGGNTVVYKITKKSLVSLRIMYIHGRLLLSAINRCQPAGTYSFPIPGKTAAGGYVMDFLAGGERVTKCVLITSR